MSSKAIYQAHGWSASTELGGIYKIIELEINNSTNSFNTAYFQTDRYISPSTRVTIKWMESVDVFVGNVITCKKLDTGPLQSSKYDIECEEVAAALQYKYVTQNGKRSIHIKNYDDDRFQKTVGNYISYLLPTDGYRDESELAFKGAKIVPSTGGRLPDMSFSNITVATAVDKVIIDLMGYGVWYEYNQLNSETRLRYGYYNHNIGQEWNAPVDTRITQRGKYYGVDGIIVYGDTNKIVGTSGNLNGNIICFRYSGCSNKAEAMSVADQIFKIRQNINTRYEVDFEVDKRSLTFREGDMIDITDPRINMVSPVSEDPSIPNGFMIYDIKIGLTKITIGLGASLQNIWDRLKSRLSIIDGDAAGSESFTIEFDWALVSGGSGELGEWVSIPFGIEGETYLGDFNLSCTFAEYGRNSYGTPITGDNVQLTQYATWDNKYVGTLAPNDSMTFQSWYYGLPKIIKWGEIDVSYVFDSSSQIGGKATVEVEWGNGVIIGDASDVPVTNMLSTVTHKWYIQENWNWGPSAMLQWKIRNSGSADIKLKDVLTKAAVFYYVSAGGSESGGVTEGGTESIPKEIQVKVELTDAAEGFAAVTLGPYIMTDGVICEKLEEDILEMQKGHTGFEIAGTANTSHKLLVAATSSLSVLFEGSCQVFDIDTAIIR